MNNPPTTQDLIDWGKDAHAKCLTPDLAIAFSHYKVLSDSAERMGRTSDKAPMFLMMAYDILRTKLERTHGNK